MIWGGKSKFLLITNSRDKNEQENDNLLIVLPLYVKH